MTAAVRFQRAIEPSARTLGTTTAADTLRDCVDRLKLDYRLTSAELGAILAGEVMRLMHGDLAYERATGHAVPLCLRYLKPASDDARVAEADALVDGITNAAVDG